MSYSDYLAGLRDGFAAGFNAGYRKGAEDMLSVGYLTGYRDGYDDASLGLPYRPQKRLLEYRSTLPDPLPLPRFEPLSLPSYEPPKLDLTPTIDLAPKYEPRFDLGPKPDLLSNDPLGSFGKPKNPWEY